MTRRVAVLLALVVSTSLAVADWGQYRGPGTTGAAAEPWTLETPSGVRLDVAWKVELGSGYSDVAVADGRVVTMFSEGEDEYVAAFDAGTGKTLWRHSMGGTEIGHDGSHDGPLSTPTIADGRVYALGSQGTFVAVSAKDGELVWSRNLVEDMGAEKPFFGFTVSPVFAGNTVVLQVGGEGSAVVGFDPATGETRWSVGTDESQYQTPAVVGSGDDALIYAAGNTKLFAIDPATGELKWETEHEGEGSGYGAGALTPLPTGPSTMFLTHQNDRSKAVRFSNDGKLETLWENNRIRGSYAKPVFHEGHLYAYSSRFLTCVDAATGDVRWRSRQPDDGFVSLFDGHLVIQTKEGSLHVVKASPDGFEELAARDVFDEVAWSSPAIVGNGVYVRSLGELARIDLREGSTFAVDTDDPMATVAGTKFGKFLKSVAKADDPKAAVAAYLEGVESFPVTEGDRVVFLYHGAANDLAVGSELIGVGLEAPMQRVEGTDLFWHAMKVTPDTRATYRLIRDYEEILDPRNPRTTATTLLGADMEFSFSGEDGEMSWFAMPGWKAPKYLERTDARGRLVDHEADSELLTETLPFQVYLPPGYDDGGKRYPVAYVHGGAPAAVTVGAWATTLDHLIGKSVEPLIVVFTGKAAAGMPQYATYFTDELVPWIDSRYRTRTEAEHRASIGQARAGIPAFFGTFTTPGVIGKLGTQSAWLFEYAWVPLQDMVKSADEQPLTIYMDWGRWDLSNHRENWNVGTINADVVATLRERGYDPAGGEAHDTTDWSSWRNRTGAMLEALFPN
jgi:outer membrane protein assembly factor BamB/enterochelin esterase-like enzyme